MRFVMVCQFTPIENDTVIYKGVKATDYEQLSLFEEKEPIRHSIKRQDEVMSKEASDVSEYILDAFTVSEIPFLGCDFDCLYPQLASMIPAEKITFECWDLNTAIACETVCAAICHQINWDFLRNAVFEKTCNDIKWVVPESLSHIQTNDIINMFAQYNKPERIRAKERAFFLRQIGKLGIKFGGFVHLFLDVNGSLLSESQIHKNLLECTVFSQDPGEKKLQLLLQKLSNYIQLTRLSDFCRPAIDYHLIRCFVRRGLISPKNKLAKEFIFAVNIERKERTTSALRQLCAILMERISVYTDLNINVVNQIEWHIGRSVCIENFPDCHLAGPNAEWVRAKFDVCPFYENCCAVKYNHNLLYIDEPTYKGTSY